MTNRVRVIRGAKDVQGDRLPLGRHYHLVSMTPEIAIITDGVCTYFVKSEFVKEQKNIKEK